MPQEGRLPRGGPYILLLTALRAGAPTRYIPPLEGWWATRSPGWSVVLRGRTWGSLTAGAPWCEYGQKPRCIKIKTPRIEADSPRKQEALLHLLEPRTSERASEPDDAQKIVMVYQKPGKNNVLNLFFLDQ